jgi:predicted ATPase/DNA-binding XRE family transcriptional regulator
MKRRAPGSFGAHLKALREAAGFSQEELATIAGLSVHAVSALERGERRRPHLETVRALCAALDLKDEARDALVASARAPAHDTAVDELGATPLPLPLTRLLGRERDLDVLQRWLADPAVRLITVTGPGGIGKTRLALEVAHAVAAQGASRVVFVPLAAIQTPALVGSAIAEALGLSNVTALDLAKRARVACANQRTLLVLDNFEHVIDAASLLAELLTSVASLRLLTTSRASLHVRGEREHAVGPLALEASSEAMSVADLARMPAVRLFVERVRDVQPDFRLTSANASTVASICRRLDALPLALELAAPWMKVLTPEDLLHRLAQGVSLAPPGRRGLPERQQTMNAAVAWSYQLLDAEERRAFRRFGALPGLFPVDAAAEVLACREGTSARPRDALGAIARLVDKSLLLRAETTVPTRPLYQMLETVRAYAALELTASGERDDALAGLARFCTAEAARAAQAMIGPAQAEWLDRVRDDLESYRRALTWLIENGRHAEASQIAWDLVFFWLIRGHAAEGLRWYEQIVNLPLLSPDAESRALLGAAVMWYAQGAHARARTALTRALALPSSTSAKDVMVQVDNMLGHVELAAGNTDAARGHFTKSIEGFRTLAISWGEGNALSGMAGVALANGDVEYAERLLNEATSVLQDAGPWFLTSVLCLRAVLTVRRGNPDRAIELVRDGLVRIRDLHDSFAFVYALVPLAAAAVLIGDDAWAARIIGARDAVTETTGAAVGEQSVVGLQEEAEREARAHLSEDRWAVAYAAGRKTSIDSLLTDIDRVLARRSARPS